MYYLVTAESDARVVKIVDDLCFTEYRDEANPQHRPLTDGTIKFLHDRYNGGITWEHEPTAFAGFKLQRSADMATITITQPRKLEDAVREHMPELIETGQAPSHIVKGKKLHDLLDSLRLPNERPARLSQAQKATQSKIGCLKYPERGSHPELTLPVHRLSCVMSCPPEPEAGIAADSLLYAAYRRRNEGITYGTSSRAAGSAALDASTFNLTQHSAERALSAVADADSAGDRTVYGLIVTYNGGAIMHATKKIGGAMLSTHEYESVGTVKAAEWIVYARIGLRALGVDPGEASAIGTDSLANHAVASNAKSASSSRFFLVRYQALHRHNAAGETKVVKVADTDNPSDFLTKWVSKAKLRHSLAYVGNRSDPDTAATQAAERPSKKPTQAERKPTM